MSHRNAALRKYHSTPPVTVSGPHRRPRRIGLLTTIAALLAFAFIALPHITR